MVILKLSMPHLRTYLLSGMLLMLPLLGSCSEVKRVYEEHTMPKHETTQFNWGIQTSISRMSIAKGEETDNYFKDAQGNLLRRWYGYGGQTISGGGTPMGGSEDEGRLPKYFGVKYYEVVENKFYKMTDAVLPQQRIYDLFQQKTVEDYSGNVISKYDQVKVSLLPQGVVWTFAQGLGNRRELGLYQAKEMAGMTVERFNNSEGMYGRALSTPIESRDEDIKFYTPYLIEALKSGWTPTADYYVNTARIRYPYRFDMSGNGVLTEFSVWYGNFERTTALPYSMNEEQVRLKAVPEDMTVYFNDKAGVRHSIHFNFYENKTFWGEPDLSAIQKTFAKFFPNRKADDWTNINDQATHEDEYATLEFHVNDDLSDITAFLIKGTQKEEIQLYRDDNGSKLKTLQPHAYWEDKPTPSLEIIDRYLKGPQSSLRTKTRIGEICPQTGYWSCEYLSSKEGLFMRAGDRMPGQSAVARGDVSADILWTLVKPEG